MKLDFLYQMLNGSREIKISHDPDDKDGAFVVVYLPSGFDQGIKPGYVRQGNDPIECLYDIWFTMEEAKKRSIRNAYDA